MNKLLSSPNIYTALWLFQILNSSFAFVSDTISVLELFFLFIWSIIIMYKGFRCSMYKDMRPVTLFLCVLTIYGLIRVFFNEDYALTNTGEIVNSRYFIISHWSSIMPIYVYYYYAGKGKISDLWIRNWSPVFLFTALSVFYSFELKAGQLLFVDFGSSTNNTSYFVLSLFPALVFWKDKSLIKYGMMAMVLAVVILCMKRGAMLISALMVLLYFRNIVSKGSSRSKIINVFFIGMIIYLGFLFVSNLIGTNDFFIERIESTIEGNSSGRDMIYERLWHYMTQEASSEEILMGLGADGTIRIIGQMAHNDWLEYFVDMGLLGIIVFLYLWFCLFRMLRNFNGVENNLSKTVFILALSFLLVRTLFSMSFSDIPLFLSSVLGFCLFQQTNKKHTV